MTFAAILAAGIAFQLAAGIPLLAAPGSSALVHLLGWIIVGSAAVSALIAFLTADQRVRYEWYRGATIAAAGVAFAFLSGFASLPASETAKADENMTIVVMAAIVAIGNGVFALRNHQTGNRLTDTVDGRSSA